MDGSLGGKSTLSSSLVLSISLRGEPQGHMEWTGGSPSKIRAENEVGTFIVEFYTVGTTTMPMRVSGGCHDAGALLHGP